MSTKPGQLQIALDARGELTTGHVRLVASYLAASERTVWRWLARARPDGHAERQPRKAFTLTDDLLAHLALLGGNCARLHRELIAQERSGGPPAPSTPVTLCDHGSDLRW
ncbi:hypothetical protein [Nonomuraea glycinis]|uniref:hypothetical protein n=1 Tax=Nonomuraea glycinis TaxID=2047744 RepID=UPI0033AEDA2C